MDTLKLFDAELLAMQYIWEHEPLQAARMADDFLELYGWKKSTTYIVLKRLESKGAILREKPKYQVRALVSREQVQHAETANLLDKMFGGSFTSLFASFLSSDRVSDTTLAELQALIEEKQKK